MDYLIWNGQGGRPTREEIEHLVHYEVVAQTRAFKPGNRGITNISALLRCLGKDVGLKFRVGVVMVDIRPNLPFFFLSIFVIITDKFC